MRIFKWTIISLLILLMISAISGYLYVDRKFTPPPNYLAVSEHEVKIPIKWVGDEYSPMAALLLPVKIDGISRKLYMQFDLGAHSTLLYNKTMASLKAYHPNRISHNFDSASTINDFSFYLDILHVSAIQLQAIDHGNDIQWDDTTKLIVEALSKLWEILFG